MSQIAHAKSSFTACIVQPFNFSTGLQVKPSVKTSDSLSLCTKHIARVGPNRILDRIYTVLLQGFSEIYGVYIRFQPTLRIAFAQVYDTRTETYITFEEAMQQVQELENQQGVAA